MELGFDGDLANRTIVNHRSRAYFNPYVVARVIIAGEHETVANVPTLEVSGGERD
jgi:hypothetical protein